MRPAKGVVHLGDDHLELTQGVAQVPKADGVEDKAKDPRHRQDLDVKGRERLADSGLLQLGGEPSQRVGAVAPAVIAVVKAQESEAVVREPAPLLLDGEAGDDTEPAVAEPMRSLRTLGPGVLHPADHEIAHRRSISP